MRTTGLACLFFLAGCQTSTPADAQANVVAQSSAPPAAAPNSQQAVDPDKMLAENDRAIAENKRMIDALQAYAKADPARLAKLRTQCQQKLGVPFDNGGATKVFNCIRDSW